MKHTISGNAIKVCQACCILSLLLVNGCSGQSTKNLAPKENGVDRGWFESVAEMKGDPVEEIQLFERSFIDDSFLVNVASYPNLKKLRLAYVNVTDDGLRHLRDLKDLKEIEFHGLAKVTGRGLMWLKGLPNVEKLNLSQMPVTDEGIRNLESWKNLKHVALTSTRVSDSSLGIIGQMENVEVLGVAGTIISDAGFLNIRKHEKLHTLYVPEHFSNQGLENIRAFKGLVNLVLDYSSVDDQGLIHLGSLDRLERISLRQTRIEGWGLKELPKSIRSLDLSDTKVSDEALQSIKKITALRALNLSYTHAGGQSVSYVKDIRTLEELHLSKCKGVTDKEIEYLSGLNNLTILDLSGTSVSNACIKHLSGLADLNS